MRFFVRVSRRAAATMMTAVFAIAATAPGAQASSGDAWEEFQQEVQQACLAEAASVITVNNIFVDPFGSESYGYAVMVGTGVGTTTGYMVVCAYDKLTQKAEVSGQFEL